MMKHLEEMFPEVSHLNNDMMLPEVAEKSYILADEIYTAQDAEEWRNGFVVSEELVASEKRLFQASMRDSKNNDLKKKERIGAN
jgi:hypothetical protein